MKISNDCLIMLEHIDNPAFFAKNGTILHTNTKAAAINIQNSGAVSDYIDNKNTDGTVSTFLAQINRIKYSVSVSDVAGLQLYVFEENNQVQQLNSILRVSQQLRSTLNSLNSSIKMLMDSDIDQNDPNISMLTKRTTKHLLSLNRSVRNMSDIANLVSDYPDSKSTIDLASYILEDAIKIKEQLSDIGIEVTFDIPEEKSYCNVIEYMIQRALYNMVSNSVKAQCTKLHISLKKINNHLFISVEDNGCGITDAALSQIKSKYRTIPDLTSEEYGLGLGMLIIQAAANAHNGTMSIENIKPTGCKVCISIEHINSPMVFRQTPKIMTTDALGGTDELLLELSEILPYTNF